MSFVLLTVYGVRKWRESRQKKHAQKMADTRKWMAYYKAMRS